MTFVGGRLLERAMSAIADSRERLERHVGRVLAERRRRIDDEREFYANLQAYCRANNLSSVCEDDWKSAAYAGRDGHHPTISSKGHVS